MAIEIIDRETDLAGKLRVRVDIDGETAVFKYPEWPGRAVVMEAARNYRRGQRVAERTRERMARLRSDAVVELDRAEGTIREEEPVRAAADQA